MWTSRRFGIFELIPTLAQDIFERPSSSLWAATRENQREFKRPKLPNAEVYFSNLQTLRRVQKGAAEGSTEPNLVDSEIFPLTAGFGSLLLG